VALEGFMIGIRGIGDLYCKKKEARRTTFLLGGRFRVGNALGSIPAKCWGGTAG